MMLEVAFNNKRAAGL